jgi:hypothetical protein
MKTLLKILGYKYKIGWMKTDWNASEFNKTVAVKVPIDVPLSGDLLKHSLKSTWMWFWDSSSFKLLYTKSPKGNNKIFQMRGTAIYHNKAQIKNLFINGLDRN